VSPVIHKSDSPSTSCGFTRCCLLVWCTRHFWPTEACRVSLWSQIQHVELIQPLFPSTSSFNTPLEDSHMLKVAFNIAIQHHCKWSKNNLVRHGMLTIKTKLCVRGCDVVEYVQRVFFCLSSFQHVMDVSCTMVESQLWILKLHFNSCTTIW